jgi:rRNA maturation endonuclease Nob1
MIDGLFDKWLDEIFVMLMSKSKKEIARLAFRAGYHACEAAQQSVQADVCPHCGVAWKPWNNDTQIDMCAICGKRR